MFLSGEREIRDTADALARLDLPGVELLPLYAAAVGRRAAPRVRPAPRAAAIVLATNVAETSLTVPGIVGVDRSRHRPHLALQPPHQGAAAADRGRSRRRRPPSGPAAAGASRRAPASASTPRRTSTRRPEFTEPEILRTNLASVILQMAALGLGDIAAFPFVEPPDAREHQGRHPAPRGARRPRPRAAPRTTSGSRTLGRRLARIPADPRLARMVLEADRHGVVGEVLVLAAALSIQDPRERPTGERGGGRRRTTAASPTRESDFLAYLNLWRYLREQQKALGSSAVPPDVPGEHLHHLRIREWQDVHSQLRQVALGIGLEVRPLAEEPDRDGIHRALLAGLLSHVGMLDPDGNEYRGAREARFVLAPGTGARASAGRSG